MGHGLTHQQALLKEGSCQGEQGIIHRLVRDTRQQIQTGTSLREVASKGPPELKHAFPAGAFGLSHRRDVGLNLCALQLSLSRRALPTA